MDFVFGARPYTPADKTYDTTTVPEAKTTAILAHWGRTDKADPTRFHPLLFHMLDEERDGVAYGEISSPDGRRLVTHR